MYDISDITIQIPEDVDRILETIRTAGYEAYIVGGCVRDSIMGRDPEDWDITTSALPEEVKGLFRNTADTGIQHGTVLVILNGRGYEVTTYRIDGKYTDGRHPESVTFTPSLEEDLKRRDFTINAFAYNPEEGVVDLFDGIGDLDKGLIRCVGEPERRFSEDALRIMRAVRFSSQLSFKIEDGTEKAISSFADRLALISRERIRVEFEKTLFSPNPEAVNEYDRLGLSGYILGPLAGKCFTSRAAGLYRKFTGADMKVLRLAAFFAETEADEADRALRELTFDNKTRETVRDIVRFKDEEIPCERPAVKRALGKMGEEVFRLVQEYRKAELGDAYAPSVLKEAESIIESGEAYQISQLDISGNDLIEAGIPRGEQIGKCLESLLDRVIEDPSLNRKETLIKLATE